jgi:hypothetical protein
VQAVLYEANPAAYDARRWWAHRRLVRGLYVASHFMYSVHMDLACKLQEYHLYVGAIIDGDSRTALILTAHTNKMPVTIYEELFLPCAREHGLPDQLVTDKGTEWYIAAFACLLLVIRSGEAGQRRRAHRCVPSKRNVRHSRASLPMHAHTSHVCTACMPRPSVNDCLHGCLQTRVERFNYEINMRVLANIRALINAMESWGLLDKYCQTHTLAFSYLMQPIMWARPITL